MSQEQRDREQPWVLAGGQAGHTTDEHVEVVADMEFFEQRVQQPSRQREAALRLRLTSEGRRGAPCRRQSSTWIRSRIQVVSCGLVVRRRVDPSRMADTSGRAPGSGSGGGHLRDGCREGRMKDVACADARCA